MEAELGLIEKNSVRLQGRWLQEQRHKANESQCAIGQLTGAEGCIGVTDFEPLQVNPFAWIVAID